MTDNERLAQLEADRDELQAAIVFLTDGVRFGPGEASLRAGAELLNRVRDKVTARG